MWARPGGPVAGAPVTRACTVGAEVCEAVHPFVHMVAPTGTHVS